MGKLWGMRAYLCGPMDRTKDRGEGWRDAITPFLKSMGVVILDPCKKPIDSGVESFEERSHRVKLKDEGSYDQLSKEVHEIRCVDLAMVDMSSFIVVHLDTNITMCGTWEEIFWANRMKRPILIHCEQGKNGIPDWIFGTANHNEFFNTWEDLQGYLDKINAGVAPATNRWMFFNFKDMIPQ